MAKKVQCSKCDAWINHTDHRQVPVHNHNRSECSGAHKKPSALKGFTYTVECPVCTESMRGDLGPDTMPVHILKGTVSRCKGGGRTPKRVEIW